MPAHYIRSLPFTGLLGYTRLHTHCSHAGCGCYVAPRVRMRTTVYAHARLLTPRALPTPRFWLLWTPRLYGLHARLPGLRTHTRYGCGLRYTFTHTHTTHTHVTRSRTFTVYTPVTLITRFVTVPFGYFGLLDLVVTLLRTFTHFAVAVAFIDWLVWLREDFTFPL